MQVNLKFRGTKDKSEKNKPIDIDTVELLSLKYDMNSQRINRMVQVSRYLRRPGNDLGQRGERFQK